jgi:hemerythrin-like domain-containing protein
MLVQLGARTVPTHLADLFVECHHRIRTFLAIAQRLPHATNRLEAAAQVHRYFTTAFPLHIADETALLSELVGVDEALHRMDAEHRDHRPAVARMIELLELLLLGRSVDDELLESARHVTALLEPHLVAEETEVFPAIRRLPRDVVDRLRAEMQARRSPA